LLGDSQESFLGEVPQQYNPSVDCFEEATATEQASILELALAFAATTVIAIRNASECSH